MLGRLNCSEIGRTQCLTYALSNCTARRFLSRAWQYNLARNGPTTQSSPPSCLEKIEGVLLQHEALTVASAAKVRQTAVDSRQAFAAALAVRERHQGALSSWTDCLLSRLPKHQARCFVGAFPRRRRACWGSCNYPTPSLCGDHPDLGNRGDGLDSHRGAIRP